MYCSVQETRRSDSVQVQSEFGQKRELTRNGSRRQEIVDRKKRCEGRQKVQSTRDWCGRAFELDGSSRVRVVGEIYAGSTPREGPSYKQIIPATLLSASRGSACASRIRRRSDAGRLTRIQTDTSPFVYIYIQAPMPGFARRTTHARCFSFPLHSAAVDTHVCHRANTTRK